MKRMAFIIALAGLVSQGWGEWKVKEIVNFDKPIIAITIGKGRNDDTNRLYCWADNTIEEVTYSDGSWYTTQICSLPSSIRGMALAKARNDDTARLYIIANSSLWEFTFRNGRWERDTMIQYSVPLRGLLAASARGDDTVRLYCGAYESGMREFSWISNRWILSDMVDTSFTLYPVAASIGRNDDTIRLYCAYFMDPGWQRKVFELTYSNGAWRKEIPVDDWLLSFWLIGDGRNDSVVRIYGVRGQLEPEWYEEVEYTYNQGEWKKEVIETYPVELTIGCLGIGDGRNLHKNYLYFAGGYPPGLLEGMWEEDHWEWDLIVPFKESEIYNLKKTKNGYRGLVIGDGRGDDTNRIYCYWPPGKMNKVIELTWETEGVEEKNSPYHKSEAYISVYPTPFAHLIEIRWRISEEEKGHAILKIYNSIGRVVKTFYKAQNQGYGIYKVIWNGRNDKGHLLPNGVYFCEIKIGTKQYIKKIVLHRKEER